MRPFEVEEFVGREAGKENIVQPRNFEEKAITMIGRPLYEAFIRDYTFKQWGKDPKELPDSILKRLPFRSNYNENYWSNCRWQGIPIGGFTELFKGLLRNDQINALLDTDFFQVKDKIKKTAKLVYSGPLDRFFNYEQGKLEWRALRFEKEYFDVEDYQGSVSINYPEIKYPFTRITEPRHFHPERNYAKNKTLVIKEYSETGSVERPYYPINDEKNEKLAQRYREMAADSSNLILGGRLGDYKYYDMDKVIEKAFETYDTKLKR